MSDSEVQESEDIIQKVLSLEELCPFDHEKMADLLQMAVDVSMGTETYIQDVQSLCTKLADLGEETLFISVNVSGNQCAYLGSTFGKEFIEKSELIQGFFSFCCDKYTATESTNEEDNKTTSQQDTITKENPKDDFALVTKDNPDSDLKESNTKALESSLKINSTDKEFDSSVAEKTIMKSLETNKESVDTNHEATKQDNPEDKLESSNVRVETNDKGVDTYDRVVDTNDRGVDTDDRGVDTEDRGVDTDDRGIETDNKLECNDDKLECNNDRIVSNDKKKEAHSSKSVDEDRSPEETESETVYHGERRSPRNQIGRKTEKKNAARFKAQGSEKLKQNNQSVENKVAEVKPKAEKDFHMRTRSGGKVKHLPWLKKKDSVKKEDKDDENMDAQAYKSASKRRTSTEHTDEMSEKKLKLAEEKIDDDNTDDKGVENDTNEAEKKTTEEREVTDTGDTNEDDGESGDLDEKNYCKICKKHFDDIQSWQDHMIEIHKESNHTCKECSKVFVSSKSLSQHLLTHSDKMFVCKKCNKCFAQERYLSRHMSEVHKAKEAQCEQCGETLENSKKLESHLSEIHNIEKTYTCELCPDKGEMDSNDFKAHNKMHDPKFKCEFCDKVCAKAHELKLHVRTHTKEKPHKCKVCNRSFARWGTLCVHTTTHRDYKAFQCEICGRCFKIKESLRQHRRVHVKESIFSCDFCKQKFRTFDGRKNHILQFHKDHQDTSRWKVYTCEYCKKDFGGRQQYIRHLSVHTGSRPFECTDCTKTYPTMSALNTHKKVHKEHKPFQCKVCNLSFLVFSKMKRHMETQKHLQWCKGYGVDPLGNLHEYEEKMKSETVRDPDTVCGVVVPEGNAPLPPFNRDLAEKMSPPSTPLIIKREAGIEETIEAEELVECVLIHIPEGVQNIHADGQTNIVYSINTEDGTVEEIFEEPATEITGTVETVFDEKTVENQTLS